MSGQSRGNEGQKRRDLDDGSPPSFRQNLLGVLKAALYPEFLWSHSFWLADERSVAQKPGKP